MPPRTSSPNRIAGSSIDGWMTAELATAALGSAIALWHRRGAFGTLAPDSAPWAFRGHLNDSGLTSSISRVAGRRGQCRHGVVLLGAPEERSRSASLETRGKPHFAIVIWIERTDNYLGASGSRSLHTGRVRTRRCLSAGPRSMIRQTFVRVSSFVCRFRSENSLDPLLGSLGCTGAGGPRRGNTR